MLIMKRFLFVSTLIILASVARGENASNGFIILFNIEKMTEDKSNLASRGLDDPLFAGHENFNIEGQNLNFVYHHILNRSIHRFLDVGGSYSEYSQSQSSVGVESVFTIKPLEAQLRFGQSLASSSKLLLDAVAFLGYGINGTAALYSEDSSTGSETTQEYKISSSRFIGAGLEASFMIFDSSRIGIDFSCKIGALQLENKDNSSSKNLWAYSGYPYGFFFHYGF